MLCICACNVYMCVSLCGSLGCVRRLQRVLGSKGQKRKQNPRSVYLRRLFCCLLIATETIRLKYVLWLTVFIYHPLALSTPHHHPKKASIYFSVKETGLLSIVLLAEISKNARFNITPTAPPRPPRFKFCRSRFPVSCCPNLFFFPSFSSYHS